MDEVRRIRDVLTIIEKDLKCISNSLIKINNTMSNGIFLNNQELDNTNEEEDP